MTVILFFIIINAAIVSLVSIFLKKEGLIALYVSYVIVSQLLINFHIIIKNQNFVLGSIAFGYIYIVIDVYNELYELKNASTLIILGIISLMVFLFSSILIMSVDTIGISYNVKKMIYGNQIRTILTDIFVSYGIMQFANIVIFDKVKKITKSKLLWLRSFCSTFLSQTLTAIFFYEIAFCGIFKQYEIFSMILSGLFIKYVIVIVEIPIMYLVKRYNKKQPSMCDEASPKS